ncbi:uncharacterized protein LOC120077920 [Benincasa hispida]|uniref:uncharacterized protein LOC120077920 n=1 Tax=Benincasa hispida TaxID=102211 RepID=UPI001902513E|nr:uncharacterized protein LOC120077920 [Benincasa hispida]
MSTYAMFLKDIISKKRSIGKYEMVALTQVNTIIPPKMRDPGSFTIPCSIGGIYIGHALCDLGASINLMPSSIFKQLEIGELTLTTVTLQLVDRSLVHLKRKLEDVLVKVDKFILPADFIILDYEADKDVPTILGWSFLSTIRARIDVHKGEIAMNDNSKKLKFSIIKAMKYPDEVHSCDIDEEWPCSFDWEADEESGPKEEAYTAVKSCNVMTVIQKTCEPMNIEEENGLNKTSLEQPLELKVSPTHLKYTFLGQSETLPIIISYTLSKEREATLLKY